MHDESEMFNTLITGYPVNGIVRFDDGLVGWRLHMSLLTHQHLSAPDADL